MKNCTIQIADSSNKPKAKKASTTLPQDLHRGQAQQTQQRSSMTTDRKERRRRREHRKRMRDSSKEGSGIQQIPIKTSKKG